LVGSPTGASGASRTAHSIIIPGESYQSDVCRYDYVIDVRGGIWTTNNAK